MRVSSEKVFKLSLESNPGPLHPEWSALTARTWSYPFTEWAKSLDSFQRAFSQIAIWQNDFSPEAISEVPPSAQLEYQCQNLFDNFPN